MNELQNSTIVEPTTMSDQTPPVSQSNPLPSPPLDESPEPEKEELTTSKKEKKPAPKLSTSERLEKTTQKIARLEKERKKLVERQRKEDTHRKIVMGGIFFNFLTLYKKNAPQAYEDCILQVKNNREKLHISEKDMIIFESVLKEI